MSSLFADLLFMYQQYNTIRKATCSSRYWNTKLTLISNCCFLLLMLQMKGGKTEEGKVVVSIFTPLCQLDHDCCWSLQFTLILFTFSALIWVCHCNRHECCACLLHYCRRWKTVTKLCTKPKHQSSPINNKTKNTKNNVYHKFSFLVLVIIHR